MSSERAVLFSDRGLLSRLGLTILEVESAECFFEDAEDRWYVLEEFVFGGLSDLYDAGGTGMIHS